jgi:hypothetical protein
MRGNAHVRFGGAGRGNGSLERAIPRPGPTLRAPALRVHHQRARAPGDGCLHRGDLAARFTFGHVRQLDKVTGKVLARAWAAGASPGDGPVTVDVDSTICEVHGYQRQGACYGYTHRLGYHPLLATRADGGEVLHARLRKGSANTARGILRFVDELVARLRRAGASGELTRGWTRDSGRPSSSSGFASTGCATRSRCVKPRPCAWRSPSSPSRPGSRSPTNRWSRAGRRDALSR